MANARDDAIDAYVEGFDAEREETMPEGSTLWFVKAGNTNGYGNGEEITTGWKVVPERGNLVLYMAITDERANELLNMSHAVYNGLNYFFTDADSIAPVARRPYRRFFLSPTGENLE